MEVLDRVTRYTGFKPEDYSKARQAAKYYVKGWDYEHFIEKYTQQNAKTWRPLEAIVAMTKTGSYAEVVDILYAASRLTESDKVNDIVTQLDAIDSEYGVY